jgi:hypothetical protein
VLSALLESDRNSTNVSVSGDICCRCDIKRMAHLDGIHNGPPGLSDELLVDQSGRKPQQLPADAEAVAARLLAKASPPAQRPRRRMEHYGAERLQAVATDANATAPRAAKLAGVGSGGNELHHRLPTVAVLESEEALRFDGPSARACGDVGSQSHGGP